MGLKRDLERLLGLLWCLASVQFFLEFIEFLMSPLEMSFNVFYGGVFDVNASL